MGMTNDALKKKIAEAKPTSWLSDGLTKEEIAQALEQVPTFKESLVVDDYISRKQVLGLKIHAPIAPVLYSDNSVHYEDIILVKDVEQLPSVEPKAKTGRWYDKETYPLESHSWECSECQEIIFAEKTNYCPNCGAKMIEPQADKE